MIAAIYKVYRSRRFVFSAKRNEHGRYVLCMFLPSSGQWTPFIGEPEHQTLADANARLDELAKMNHWQCCNGQRKSCKGSIWNYA